VLTVHVSPDGGGRVTLDPPEYGYNVATEVTLTAVANEGYVFSHWSGDLSGSENPTIILVNCDKEVTAHFTQITCTLTVNVSPSSGGDVEVDDATPYAYPATYTFACGASVSLEAFPAAGHDFASWSGDLSGWQNPTSITMDSDKEVTAHFVRVYTLEVDVGPSSGGDVEVDDATPSAYPATYTFAYGASVNLEAFPAPGYDFASWSGDLSGWQNPTTITMDSDKEVTAHFVHVYTLAVDVSPSGGGTVTLEPSQPAGKYVAGTEVHLTAVASEGYEFDHWSGALSSSENPITITVDSDKEVTAHFSQITYILTVDVGPGGSIEVDGVAPSAYPAPSTFVYGASIALRAISATGYEFANWGGDLAGSTNPTSIVMDGNKTVTANFNLITYTLTVDVSPGGGGTVTLEPSEPAGGYVAGAEVTLTALASEGYEFDHWSGDLSGSENPTSIELDSDKEATAHFTQVTYTLAVDVSPGGGMVTLEPSQPAEGYVVGTEVSLTAVASEGYKFDHWSGAFSSSENPATMGLDSDKEVTAHFVQIYTLTVDVNLGGGMVTLEPSQPAGGYVAGTEVSLTAVASEGYKLDRWSGALFGSENPTMTTMDSDKVVTAHFVQIYTLTVDVNLGGGMVILEPSEPAGGYVVGTEVSLTAVADEGYEFDHWSSALSSSGNPITIRLDSDKKITAHFSHITYTLTVDVSPGGGGTVILEPSEPAGGYVAGAEVTLTAMAGEGYEFDHWSGDLSGSEDPITLVTTMDSTKALTASFTKVAAPFPWWWIVVGVVVIGLVVYLQVGYFLVVKRLWV
jgi:uncharacterized repeat protein (TIGR02543 family)